MTPILEDSQHVPVKQSKLYLPGDILVFQDQFGQVLAHRLLGCFLRQGKICFLTQADNAPGVDAGIYKRQIIGKVQQAVAPVKRLTSVVRFVQHASKWMAARVVR
ncbi:S24/S26 family peptidase [Thiolapillus sp.]